MDIAVSLQNVRTKKYGDHFFVSFVSPTTGKRKRLPKKLTGLLPTKEAAEEWVSKHMAQVIRKELDLLERQKWRTDAHIVLLVNQFETHKKLEIPQSYWQVVGGLKNYVLPYFVVDQGIKDPNLWHKEHQRFKSWLLTEAKTDSGKTLSVSTANKCINSLNKYCEWLRDHARVLNWDNCRPLQAYPNHMLNRRGAQDLLDVKEFEMVTGKLRANGHDLEADMWVVQYHTGMRVSEIVSLPLSGLTSKVPTEIKEAYEKAGLTPIYGAVYLMSQPRDNYLSREKNHVPRKPLKWRKTISPKDARTIPITDKAVWNILAIRFATQKELYAKFSFGADKDDYLLFDGAQVNTYLVYLKQAYEGLGLRPKSSHLLRHTRATELTLLGLPDKIQELVMGHKGQAQQRYQHIVEVLNRKTQADADFDDIKVVL
ncbi:MAG TPA: hypothetical protein V6C65_26255 [Allocoleopsis sp.]